MMRRVRIPPIAWVDALAVLGLGLLALGIALLTVPAAALVVVGIALLIYAVAVSASTTDSAGK